jgi:hypothetical protein
MNGCFGPSLLVRHNPSVEHAATDQLVAKSPPHQISAAQLLSAIQIDHLASAFTFRLFTCQLALTANGFLFLARFPNRRLLEMLFELHFTEYTFTLELFLERPKRLIHVVITNTYLHFSSVAFPDILKHDLSVNNGKIKPKYF